MATLTAQEICEKYGVSELIKPKEKKTISLLNVSKCSVLEIKEELERRGVCDEDDETTWKAFKDIETKIWLESYQKAKEEAGGEAASKDGELQTAAEVGKFLSNSGALTFQDIEAWSMYDLRQQMQDRGMLEAGEEGEKSYKLFEEMLAKLVRELLGQGVAPKKVDKKPMPEPTAEELGDDWVSVNVKKEDEKGKAGEGGVGGAKTDGVPHHHLLAGQRVGHDLQRTKELAEEDLSNPEFIPNIEDITIDSAPKLTIYQIRQVLERNNLFEDFKSGKKKISYNAVLNALVAYLVEKKEKFDVVYSTTLEKTDDLKARLAAEKAKRKADALERSRLRQLARKKAEEENSKAPAPGEEGGPEGAAAAAE
jgi:hypothetical protein